jgi:hypothetical protein
MKKMFFLFSVLFLMSQASWATNYYSAVNSAPNLTASWWTGTDGTGSHPSNFTSSGNIFIIQAGDTMTTSANWTVSGTGSAVQINGKLIASNTVSISSLAVNSGGTYQHNINGGTIPTATWDVNSTLYVTGVTSSVISSGLTGQNLGNLTWNCPSQTSASSAASGILTVKGNLTVQNTGTYQFRVQGSPITVNGNLNIAGGSMLVGGNNAKVLIVGGDVNVSADTLYIYNYTSTTTLGILYVAGNFNVSGTGVVTNTMATNTNSTINFNGSSLQTITNSGTISGLLNFTFNNASGISLGSDLSISGVDTMRNGNIALNGHTLTLGTATSSTGTLVWTNGFITGSGTFKRWFGTSAITIGNVAGLFPMGSGTYNRSVWIGGTPSTGGTVSVQHSDVSGTTDLSFIENSKLFDTRTNMNWLLATTSFVGTSLSLRIQGSGIPAIDSVSHLNISLSAGAAGGTYSAPGGTIANPLVNRTGLTQTTLANTFYFAATSTSLPVELTSFTGSVKEGIVKLNWTTATEVNNHGFSVERLSSGKAWQSIGFVQGSGNSNSVKNYSFADNIAKAGSYSYRLQQVDNNGAYAYSSVIEVNNNTLPTGFSIGNYPNPFNPSTIIRYALPVNTFVNITIYNMLGQKMATLVNQNMEQGEHEVSFNASRFASGTYIYKIEAGSFSATKNMLLIK